MKWERWIKCIEGPWEVSDHGRMRFAEEVGRGPAKRYPGDIVKFRPNRDGYQYTVLTHYDGEKHGVYLHKYVANYFIGPRPLKLTIAHADNNKANNRVTNLSYKTMNQNNKDAQRDGLCGSKLTRQDVEEIKNLQGQYSGRSLAKTYHVSRNTIYKIWEGKRLPQNYPAKFTRRISTQTKEAS